MEIDNALAEKGGQPSRPSSFLQKNDRSIYTFTEISGYQFSILRGSCPEEEEEERRGDFSGCKVMVLERG